MKSPLLRSVLGGTMLSLLLTASYAESQPVMIAFRGGRTIPVSALSVANGMFVLKQAVENLPAGQTVPLDSAETVLGDKPIELMQATAFVLQQKPADALKLLEPILVENQATATVPGNFWVEAARSAIIAYAMINNEGKVRDLKQQLDKANGGSADPIGKVVAALSLKPSTKFELKEQAFSDAMLDSNPVDVIAFAAYFRGQLFESVKDVNRALESYFSIVNLYPTGNNVVNAAAHFRAGEMILVQPTMDAELQKLARGEAIGLFKAAAADAKGTVFSEEAAKRLESLK